MAVAAEKIAGHTPMMHKWMFGIADGTAEEIISGILNFNDNDRENSLSRFLQKKSLFSASFTGISNTLYLLYNSAHFAIRSSFIILYTV